MELFSIFGSGGAFLLKMGFWDYFVWPFGQIFKLFYKLVPSFSLAVLLFALFFKLVLFPLDVKRQRSQAKMMRFQPKIAEIQKKYAEDREKMNEEMQKLYTQEGYSPMSGCLPSLLPLPIFFALYGVITKPLTFLAGISSELIDRLSGVLAEHVPDLMTTKYNVELLIHQYVGKSEYSGWFSGIPADTLEKIRGLDMTLFGLDLTMGVKSPGASAVLWVFPVLTVLISVVSGYVMGRITKKNNEGMQGANAASSPLMVIGMPLMTGILTYAFPAGVLLYWIYNSLLMMVANLILNKFWPMKKMVAEYEAKLEKMRAEGKATTGGEAFRRKLMAAQEKNAEKTRQYEEYRAREAANKKELERRAIARAREEERKRVQEDKEREYAAPNPKAREDYLKLMSKKKDKDKNRSAGGLG